MAVVHYVLIARELWPGGICVRQAVYSLAMLGNHMEALRKAAERGLAKAQGNLGNIYSRQDKLGGIH